MDIVAFIREQIEASIPGKFRNVSELASVAGVSQPNLSGFMKGNRSNLSIVTAWKILETLGVEITFPDHSGENQSRDVCWVDVQQRDGAPGVPPAATDYLAVPLVDEVGAGPGYIPQNQLKSWFLVWRYQKGIRYKIDLIAVQLGENSTSMVPTLRPRDIVIVDRQDRDVSSRAGRIMLVMDPDGAGKIKRVATTPQIEERDVRIIFYSDNAETNPPEVWSLMRDYAGDWNRCVVGHVVWAWSDMDGR